MPVSLDNSDGSKPLVQGVRTVRTWDAFVSHASEDKETLARPLAVSITRLGADVWFDEFTLRPGDSLSKSIDHGLSNSRYGIVLISTHFIQKRWTEYELRGLTNLEIDQGSVIIPIWHEVTWRQVLAFSPPLADKFALRTNGMTVEDIAIQVLRKIRPDLYARHPRSELARLASGEALRDLQAELGGTRAELSAFKCPVCGAPVEKRGPMFGWDGRDSSPFCETFECGFQKVDDFPYRLCPLDPNFPAFEDYELRFEYLENHQPTGWMCTAKPRTEYAKQVEMGPVFGATRGQVEEKLREGYRRAATRWKAGEGQV